MEIANFPEHPEGVEFLGHRVYRSKIHDDVYEGEAGPHYVWLRGSGTLWQGVLWNLPRSQHSDIAYASDLLLDEKGPQAVARALEGRLATIHVGGCGHCGCRPDDLRPCGPGCQCHEVVRLVEAQGGDGE